MSIGLVQKDASYTNIRTKSTTNAKNTTKYFAGNVRKIGALVQTERNPGNWVTIPQKRVPTILLGSSIDFSSIGQQQAPGMNAISADGSTVAYSYLKNSNLKQYINILQVVNNVPQYLLNLVISPAVSAPTTTPISMSADGNSIFIGSSNLELAAFVKITQRNPVLIAVQYLEPTPEPGFSVSSYGYSVQMSADASIVVVGAPTSTLSSGITSGCAFVFTKNELGIWSQLGSALIGTGYIGQTILQGHSLAISADGNTIASAGIVDDSDKGAVWVFKRNAAGTFQQFGEKITYSGSFSVVLFGNYISLSGNGDTLVVSYTVDTETATNVEIFKQTGTGYAPKTVLPPSPLQTTNLYQGPVSLSAAGDVLLVCSAIQGAAWIYTATSADGTFVYNGQLTGNLQPNLGAQGILSADGSTALLSSSTAVGFFR